MMVGVHTLVPGNFTEEEDEPAYALTSRPRRILQELWLYDVEKMPTAVKISGDEDGFKVNILRPPVQSHQGLLENLNQISWVVSAQFISTHNLEICTG